MNKIKAVIIEDEYPAARLLDSMIKSVRPEWETEIVCPDCSTSYSVIGTAYFCPCCGRNNVKTALIDSMSSIEKMIDSLDDLEEHLEVTHAVQFSGFQQRDAQQDIGVHQVRYLVRAMARQVKGSQVDNAFHLMAP